MLERSILVAAVVAGCSSSPAPTATDLGPLSKPAVVTARDGGAAARIGSRILWTFGDTLMTAKGDDGFNYRSATGAWGAPGELLLEEPLDGAGAPFQLLPYTSEEAAYNRANGPTERYALWPGSVVAAPDDTGAWIIYQRLKIHPGTLNYEYLDVGLARLALGSTTAVRDPGPLFSAPTAAYALGATVDSGNLYLYTCSPVPAALDSLCSVIRAGIAEAPTPGAWQAWDGSSWTSDLGQAATVLHGGPGDLSVSFNQARGEFIAVYSGVFSNDVWWRTAPRPEGPWSAPRRLFTALAPSAGNDYAAKEHPEMSTDAGRTLVVSYARMTDTFAGEVRLTAIDPGGN